MTHVRQVCVRAVQVAPGLGTFCQVAAAQWAATVGAKLVALFPLPGRAVNIALAKLLAYQTPPKGAPVP
jgi:hypothetical protein